MTELATQELARARAARIRAGIQTYLHTLADVSAAYAQRDWTALGYADWQSYVDGEYGAERLRLSPEHRQKAVAELRLAGMSTRAIGSALGVSKDTVARELAGVSSATPVEIQGADGKTYAATRPSSPAGRDDAPQASPGSDRSGQDHPVQAGEADAQLVRDGATNTDAIQAPTDVASRSAASVGAGEDSLPAGDEQGAPAGGATSPAPPAVDPIDDPEHIARQHREGSSAAVAEALVSIKMRLEPDPIRWLNETWIPGGYRFRDMPRVVDCFTPEGLRTSATYLNILADHLEATGDML
jgi:hypothetical protein